MKLRCGIVGTGAFAHIHAEALRDHPSATLVAACNPQPDEATEFIQQWSGTLFSNLRTFLEYGLDIVTIASPDETHATIAKEIITSAHAPRLLIVEKPLCMTREEWAMLKELKTKTHVVVDHSRRFNAGFETLQSLIASQALGVPTSIHWKYYAGWMHIGVHVIDTLRMLYGDLSVTGATVKGVDRYPDDPLLDVHLTAKNYPATQIELEGVAEHPHRFFEADLLFTKGKIHIAWDDIVIERNAQTEQMHAEPIAKALENLYAQSAALLQNDDRRILDAAGLHQAGATMEILFDAKTRARA